MERNDIRIANMLRNGETVYMKDDFYDMAIRFYETEAGTTKMFRKLLGYEEAEISPDNETAFDIQVGGEFISKEEYDAFS